MRVTSLLSTIVGNQVSRHGLLFVLVGSLCLNVVQAQRLRALIPVAPAAAATRVGTTISQIRLSGNDGTAVNLVEAASERPTILYYFSATCGWCERNWQNVAALEHATRERYRFVAASAAGHAAVAAKHSLGFPVYSGLTSPYRRALGFDGTPQMAVLSPSGKVLKVWAGAFNGGVRSEIERYFGVSLPGLTPTPAQP